MRVQENRGRLIAKNSIFSIDYRADHEVVLGDLTIGSVNIEGPVPGGATLKIIDLRGLGFVRRDYRSLFEAAHMKDAADSQ